MGTTTRTRMLQQAQLRCHLVGSGAQMTKDVCISWTSTAIRRHGSTLGWQIPTLLRVNRVLRKAMVFTVSWVALKWRRGRRPWALAD